MGEQTAISLDGVTKRFGKYVAVDALSYEVNRHDVFGFIGPNGAGKTTTIKMIVGLLHPEAGELRVSGHRMPADKEQAHRELGYLSQYVAFQSWRTVTQVLSTFGRLSGLNTTELPGRIDKVLKRVGLGEEYKKKAIHLSGGQARRLGLAQAILHRPNILILDEPLAGLDPANRLAVKNIIGELVEAGSTVLFSSHILSDVQDVATRVGILRRGHLVRAGTIDELRAEFSVGQDIEIVLSHDSGKSQELTEIPGIARLEQLTSNRVLAHLDGSTELDDTIHDLIQGLLAHQSRIRSIRPLTPSLDDIYFSLLNKDQQERSGGQP